jgi:hypothetical protein
MVSNYRITEKSIPLPGNAIFYGDYIDIDSRKGVTAIVYPKYGGLSCDIEVAIFTREQLKNASYANNMLAGLILNKGTAYLTVKSDEDYEVKAKVKIGKPLKKKSIKIKRYDMKAGEETIWKEDTGSGLHSTRYKVVLKSSSGKKIKLKSRRIWYMG